VVNSGTPPYSCRTRQLALRQNVMKGYLIMKKKHPNAISSSIRKLQYGTRQSPPEKKVTDVKNALHRGDRKSPSTNTD